MDTTNKTAATETPCTVTTCHVCGWYVSFTKKGLLFKHGSKQTGHDGGRCPGSGQPAVK